MRTFRNYVFTLVALLAVVITLAITTSHHALAQVVGRTSTPVTVVRDEENTARHPYDEVVTQNTLGQSAQACTPPVPPGKRLVIEFASVQVAVPSGQKPLLNINNPLGGFGHFNRLVLTPQGTFGTADVFAFSQPIRLYADAGFPVCVEATREGTTGNITLLSNISGYLVDTP